MAYIQWNMDSLDYMERSQGFLVHPNHSSINKYGSNLVLDDQHGMTIGLPIGNKLSEFNVDPNQSLNRSNWVKQPLKLDCTMHIVKIGPNWTWPEPGPIGCLGWLSKYRRTRTCPTGSNLHIDVDELYTVFPLCLGLYIFNASIIWVVLCLYGL